MINCHINAVLNVRISQIWRKDILSLGESDVYGRQGGRDNGDQPGLVWWPPLSNWLITDMENFFSSTNKDMLMMCIKQICLKDRLWNKESGSPGQFFVLWQHKTKRAANGEQVGVNHPKGRLVPPPSQHFLFQGWIIHFYADHSFLLSCSQCLTLQSSRSMNRRLQITADDDRFSAALLSLGWTQPGWSGLVQTPPDTNKHHQTCSSDQKTCTTIHNQTQPDMH